MTDRIPVERQSDGSTSTHTRPDRPVTYRTHRCSSRNHVRNHSGSIRTANAVYDSASRKASDLSPAPRCIAFAPYPVPNSRHRCSGSQTTAAPHGPSLPNILPHHRRTLNSDSLTRSIGSKTRCASSGAAPRAPEPVGTPSALRVCGVVVLRHSDVVELCSPALVALYRLGLTPGQVQSPVLFTVEAQRIASSGEVAHYAH